jgi:allantoate deiminase
MTDVAGETTRLFLSPASRDAETLIGGWICQAGLTAHCDDFGNLRATRRCPHDDAPTLVLFSHIDVAPNSSHFNGSLGVLLAIAAVEQLGATSLPLHIEIIAFSDEEGARFGVPSLSSLAVTGRLRAEHLERADGNGISVADAIRAFGLVPGRIPITCPLTPRTFAAVETRIEPVPGRGQSDSALAVVESILGVSRLSLAFQGQCNHAGTAPMPSRGDALAAAAHWIAEVEHYAANYTQLTATVDGVHTLPATGDFATGTVQTTLEVRHPRDESRHAAVAHLLTKAEAAGTLRGVQVRAAVRSEQSAVPLDRDLTLKLHRAAERAGYDAPPIFSAAGHSAMILAAAVPTAMLLLRSPVELSHVPGDDLRCQDVEAALATLLNLLLHLHPHPKLS